MLAPGLSLLIIRLQMIFVCWFALKEIGIHRFALKAKSSHSRSGVSGGKKRLKNKQVTNYDVKR